MITSIQLDAKSFAHLQSTLSALPRNVAIKTLRIALNAWGGIVKRREVELAKQGPSDLLPKAIAVRVIIPAASRNPIHGGKPARVMVGASRSFSRTGIRQGSEFKALSATKQRLARIAGRRAIVRRPSRYAHFVESGIAGRVRTTPAPFVGPAQKTGESEGLRVFIAKLDQGIQREAMVLAKR